jgi:hypothetical protein
MAEEVKKIVDAEIVTPDESVVEQPAEANTEEDGDEDEEEEELSPEEERMMARIDKRSWIMSQCLYGAVEAVLEVVNNALKGEKSEATRKAVDADAQFAAFGAALPDINRACILSTASMLASKIYESVVPAPKPRDFPDKQL